jgi:hypothetical protein
VCTTENLILTNLLVIMKGFIFMRYEFFPCGNCIGAVDVKECTKCVIRNYAGTCQSNLCLTARIENILIVFWSENV